MVARVEGLPTERKAMYAIYHGKVVGEGSYRKVFRTGRSRWVYKVDTTRESVGSNSYEWQTYLEYCNAKLAKGVKIPEMHLIDGNIIACEYIKGKHPKNECYRDYHVEECPGEDNCWAEKVKNIKIADIHFQNVLISKDGTIYIIDLGHGETYQG